MTAEQRNGPQAHSPPETRPIHKARVVPSPQPDNKPSGEIAKVESGLTALEWALAYAKAGIKIFPCYLHPEGNKPPLWDGWQKDVTDDPERIKAWFDLGDQIRTPPMPKGFTIKAENILIGMPTGFINGFDVFDIDSKNGVDGHETIGPDWKFCSSVISETPNGPGHQLFFRHERKLGLKNQAGKLVLQFGKTRVPMPGVDVRTTGGYVILPGSVFPDGRQYRWHRGGLISAEGATLALTEANIELLTRHQRTRTKTKPKTAPEPALVDTTNLRAKAIAWLQRRAQHCAEAPKGSRDDTTNKEIFKAAWAVNAELLTREEVEEIFQIAKDNGLGDRAIDEKLRRSLEDGIRKDVSPPRGFDRQEFDLTESGNAERIVAEFGDDLRYCKPWKIWLVWDGRRWKRDRIGQARKLARRALKAIFNEAGDIKDNDRAARMAKWYLKSRSRTIIDNSLNLCQELLPVLPEELDSHDWLFNVGNGTLDLRTQVLHEHRREDLITKLVDVDYDADAACPIFSAFRDRIYANDTELIAFVQRAVGFSLTGMAHKRPMFLLFGEDGNNGKTTLLELLLCLGGGDGEYAKAMELSALLHKDRASSGATPGIAELFGARIATAVESEDGARLSEVVVKRLLGGDTITARRLFEQLFSFVNKSKIWLALNHLPKVKGTDNAIWERVMIIPHNVVIPAEEIDRKLGEKLKAELPGVLNWALEGCRAWNERGLDPPECVKVATDQYRLEQNTLGRLLASSYRTGLAHIHRIPVATVYTEYVSFCNDDGAEPMSKNKLSDELTKLGWESKQVKLSGMGNTRCWVGVKFNDGSVQTAEEEQAMLSFERRWEAQENMGGNTGNT